MLVFDGHKFGFGKDWNRLDESLFGSISKDFLQRPDRRLKGFTITGKGCHLGHGGCVGSTGFSSHEGTFSEPISLFQDLIVVIRISQPNVVDSDLTFIDDVENITLLSLFDNSFSFLEFDSFQNIGKFGNRRSVQVFEQINFGQNIDNVGFFVHGRSCQKMTEGSLIDFPEDTVGSGDTGGRTGRIVQQRQFPKGSAHSARSDRIAVGNEIDRPLLANIKEISNVSLFDNHFALLGFLFLHGVDEHFPFLVCQIGKDKVLSEGLIKELAFVVGFGIHGRGEVAFKVHDSTSEGLTVLIGLGMDLQLLLASSDTNMLGITHGGRSFLWLFSVCLNILPSDN
mmetsp:Transcript_26951/g.44429  ORF Transcript_26951/g.44429 Transcript_26951/m.44429 type:complete len:340 (-) Transcript_26951:207-1226(-)